jgi:hypothetical protein
MTMLIATAVLGIALIVEVALIAFLAGHRAGLRSNRRA